MIVPRLLHRVGAMRRHRPLRCAQDKDNTARRWQGAVMVGSRLGEALEEVLGEALGEARHEAGRSASSQTGPRLRLRGAGSRWRRRWWSTTWTAMPILRRRSPDGALPSRWSRVLPMSAARP